MSFADEELVELQQIAASIPVQARDAFLAALAEQLKGRQPPYAPYIALVLPPALWWHLALCRRARRRSTAGGEISE